MIPSQVYKSSVGPWRFDSVARGVHNDSGQYTKAVLSRFVAHHVKSLKEKDFGSKLLHPRRRSTVYTLTLGEETYESKKALLKGKMVGHGDVCLGEVPCIIEICLCSVVSNKLSFIVQSLQLQAYKVHCSVWTKSGVLALLSEDQIGPCPCWWTFEDDKIICIV